jgi:hypothetical protein
VWFTAAPVLPEHDAAFEGPSCALD